MKEEDKNTIIQMYFQDMKNYSEILGHFNNKYTYAEVKSVIQKHIRGK